MRDTIFLHGATALGNPGHDRPGAPFTEELSFDRALATRLHDFYGTRLRQTSRFTQLAVAGASLCARAADLASGSGVYLGTGLGDIRTAAVLFARGPAGTGRASPFDFVNVNNNTAAYYVARTLGLSGPNLTVSQGELSFEWALRLATADVRAGLPSALVGGVDERPATPLDLTRRLRLKQDQQPGEGSSWIALTTGPAGAAGRLLGMHWSSGFSSQPDRDPSLLRFLERLPSSPATHVLPGFRLQARTLDAVLAARPQSREVPYLGACGCHHSAAAYALGASLGHLRADSELWVHVNQDESGRTVALAWEAFARTP